MRHGGTFPFQIQKNQPQSENKSSTIEEKGEKKEGKREEKKGSDKKELPPLPDLEEVEFLGSADKLKNNHDRSIALKEQGNEYLKKNQLPEALQAYTQSIQFDPLNSLSFANRALVYIKLTRYFYSFHSSLSILLFSLFAALCSLFLQE